MDEHQSAELRTLLSSVRPRIETGYENMLVARLVLERMRSAGRVDSDDILAKWGPQMRDECLASFKETTEELIAFYGETRDALIRENRTAWLELNAVYPFVRQAFETSLNHADFYIITTKQRRFVREIMDYYGLRCPPDSWIFDLDSDIRGKANVLRHLLERDQAEGTVIHFVEDRFETLRTVADTEGLEAVRLYLVDWGYNLEHERRTCEQSDRVKLLRPQDFAQLAATFAKPQQNA